VKYKSINELDEFSLHDAELEKVEIQDKNMIWTMRNANVTTKNSQNDNETDMCVDIMKMAFINAKIKNITWSASETRDDKGNTISKTEAIKVEEELESILKGSLDKYCSIHGYSLVKELDARDYIFTMNTGLGVYDMRVMFDEVVAEWDSYKGEAWYVHV